MKNSSSHVSFSTSKATLVRQIAIRVELRAAPLQQLDQGHRLAIQRRVLGRGGRADMRLQRDVAEILQREDAELVGCPSTAGTGRPDPLHQLRDVGERQIDEVDRTGVQRQHDRRPFVENEAEVFVDPTRRRSAAPRARPGDEPAVVEVAIDSIADVGNPQWLDVRALITAR